MSGGKGVEYDAFIALRNLDDSAAATASIIYRNQDNTNIKEPDDVTIAPLAAELVDVEDTVFNWGMGSAEIDWSGSSAVIAAAYIWDRARGMIVDMPVISATEAAEASVRYVPYGKITEGPVSGFDTFVFLKNTSPTESITVNLTYYKHDGSTSVSPDPVVLPPLGSTRVNVESTIDARFGWGGGEISWTPAADGTIAAAAALVNWNALTVTSIPIK